MKIDKSVTRSMAILVVGAGSHAFILPAQAEALPSNSELAADSPVCMSRPRDNIAQVRDEDRGQSVFVAVVPRSVEGLRAKGFALVDCKSAGFGTPGDYIKYRDEMCQLTSVGNEAVQNQLARALGERPAVLCANAQVLTRQFERNVGTGT